MSTPTRPPRPHADLADAMRRREAWLVLGLLLALTLLGSAYVEHRSRIALQSQVERDAELLTAMIRQQFDVHRDGLASLRHRMEARFENDWRSFSNHIEILYPALNFPAFVAFGYAPKFAADEREGLEAWTSRFAHAPFPLRNPKDGFTHPLSFPIVFHHPVASGDESAAIPFHGWGVDLNQDPHERDQMRWAWGHGARLATTRPGDWPVGPGSRSQIRLYHAVMSDSVIAQDWHSESNQIVRMRGLEGENPKFLDDVTRLDFNDRRLRGVVFGVLDVERLLRIAIPPNAFGLHVAIHDMPPVASQPPMAGEVPTRSLHRTVRKERFYGRDWWLEYGTGSKWNPVSLGHPAWTVLAFGAVVSLTAGFATGFRARAIDQALDSGRRAETQNAELSRARDDLQEIQRARQQLQRNLHDSVLQRLYAASLHARRLCQASERGEAVPPVDLRTQVTELDGAMAELRSFLTDPSTRTVAPEELGAALRGLTLAFNRQTAVQVTLEAAPETLESLPPGCGEHLLQMVREGLSNAWRHGHARNIVVRVSLNTHCLNVEVEDDGIGFDPSKPRPGGRGLVNLAERAELCGGRLQVQSKPGGPTLLRVTVDETPS